MAIQSAGTVLEATMENIKIKKNGMVFVNIGENNVVIEPNGTGAFNVYQNPFNKEELEAIHDNPSIFTALFDGRMEDGDVESRTITSRTKRELVMELKGSPLMAETYTGMNYLWNNTKQKVHEMI